ncbi:MAG: hypothetical protein K0R90_1146, partial [Oscillospiraceae bacterium]|nr:hypothetical protein [Oscillospiraceae bacterium]
MFNALFICRNKLFCITHPTRKQEDILGLQEYTDLHALFQIVALGLPNIIFLQF